MIIDIHPEKKLKDINNVFKTVYPFLKLEFFKNGHQWKEYCPGKNLLSQELTVDEATIHQSAPGFMEIHYWQKTGLLESKFLSQFNLIVQVYRKYGDLWIQTSGTDVLSLEEQNELGMQTSSLQTGFSQSSDIEKDI